MPKTLVASLKLMRFDKPIGVLLLWWPVLWALFIAGKGQPPLLMLVIFSLGVVVMRAAGCVVNDMVDYKTDQAVARTKTRPIAAGDLTHKQATAILMALLSVALLLVLQLNWLTVYCAIAALSLTFLYPLTKYFFVAPQFVLAITFNAGVFMVFTALTQQLPPVAFVLYAIACLWTIYYDTQYAMADREDDKKINIHSTAIWFGKQDKLFIGILQLAMLALLICLGMMLGKGLIYFIMLAIVAACMLYQQILIADRNRDKCHQAFCQNNIVGLVIFIGLLF